MDDPLALLAFAVWTLAIGMYPLGFMFGVCSACCDECPDECNKCSGGYHFDPERGPCYETFDLYIMESSIDSASLANVVTSDNKVGLILGIFQADDCIGNKDTEGGVMIQLEASFLDRESIIDECGCRRCNYIPRQFLQFEGFGLGVTCDPEIYPNVLFDKCAQGSALVNLSFTKEQIAGCLEQADVVCNDLPDAFDVTVTLSLDFDCECGACCRDGTCTENEPEGYCEQNTAFFNDLGDGLWQGVGTNCTPNECPSPE